MAILSQQITRLLGGHLRVWFGVAEPVSARVYAVNGFALMIFKYAVEAATFWTATGRLIEPPVFFDPLLSRRMEAFGPAPMWLGWAEFVWTLPFLWIAVSMSVRRAADAGFSPWFGLVVLVPMVNYLLMIALCLFGSDSRSNWSPAAQRIVFDNQILSALSAITASLVVGLLLLAISVYGAGAYGTGLFMATPLVTGAIAGYLHNYRHSRPMVSTLGVAALALVSVGTAMLLFALEGVLCVAMATPLVLPVGLLGGVIGKAIADHTGGSRRDISSAACLLPLVAMAHVFEPAPELRVVETNIVVERSPDEVWQNTINFRPIDAPLAWYFRLGIAYPTNGWIDCPGPTGVRHCVFSTGAFVEPIRTWDPPGRLAFDVQQQPPPMRELSPYAIHPPHLDGFMLSRRGEFRLIPLGTGRTRLEGRTWYQLRMSPQYYWHLWADAIIGRIHQRVLRHIKDISEA